MIGDALHLEKELMMVNRSVPVNRRTIADYADNGDLFYSTKDGHICELDQGELDFLCSICSPTEMFRVRLPILIYSDTSGDCTSWKVEGPADISLVAKILRKSAASGEKLRFYNPDLKKLRQILEKSTFLVFSP